MKLTISRAVASVLGIFLIGPAAQAQTVTPAQWLASQPKPAFKAGHTLPRLTRYGWSMPLDVRVKLCEDWGYALEFGRAIGLGAPVYDGVVYDTAWRLNDPNSGESQMAALAKADPVRYPLSVEITKRMPTEAEAPAGSYARNANGETLYSGVQQQPDGTSIPAGPVWSLEAPQATWDLCAEYRVSGLRELQSRGIPIAYMLNGGEYGIEFWLNEQLYWEQDPRYNNAVAQSPYGQGLFLEYCSAAEASTEHIIASAVKNQVPQRALYVPYTAGGRTERNRYYAINEYGGFWEHTRGQGDLPSKESYYRSNGDGFVTTSGNGRRDMLTQALNAKALEIQTGNPLSYDWISAGWESGRGTRAEWVAEMNRWAGLLKCFYTAGMIGSNVGDYEGPASLPGGYSETNGSHAGYEASFPSTSPPNFLKHQVASSHIHALFSQVENIVRNSDLLPGPAQHEMSGDVPAYEFPTGEGENARVLARKHHTNATWLITAWAAAGANRNVTVYIPELGQLTLEARIVGSVYKATLANGNVTLVRIDNEGATYTAVADGTPVVTPVNLAIPGPLAANRLFWLAADSGVTADASGKVSSWASQGNSALTVTQGDANRRPTLIPNAIGGKPAVRFVNTQSWLGLDLGAAEGDAFIGDLNVFAVFTGAGLGRNNRVVSGADTQSGADYLGGFNMNDNVDNLSEVRDGVLVKLSGKQCTARLRSLYVGDAVGPAGPGGYNGLTGDIAEILIYKPLSRGMQAQVINYLQAKYGIATNTSLANSSFESPAVSGYRVTPNQGSSWFFTNYSAIQANNSAWGAATAPNGNQTAVLQGAANQAGSMSQTLTLDAGNYTLSFKAARRSGQIQPLRVMIDSTQIGGLITPTSNSFEDFTVNFNVNAGKHTIRFEVTDAFGDKSTFIDDVKLNSMTVSGSGYQNFFTALYTGTRNDFTGNVGYEFTPSANTVVTALGRPVSGTMSNNHDVKIWRVSDQALVASTTVTPTSVTDELGYKRELLAAPVTLSAGVVYRITSYETNGGDAWMNVGSISSHLGTASISQGVWISGTTYPLNIEGSADQGYAAPTFYTSGSALNENFFTALYTGTRNDYTGNVGYEFTPVANTIVKALGRPVSGTMSNNHNVKIWRVSDQTVVASAIVSPASATDELGYKYELLASSVTLSANTSYRITSYETSGGDAWLNYSVLSSHRTSAAINTSVWSSGDVYPVSTGGGTDMGHAAPTFYTSGSASSVASTALLKAEAENYAAMSGVQTAASGDTGGTNLVGWIDAGDWMDYTVTLPETRRYDIQLRVASPFSGKQLQLQSGGSTLATVNIPNTGGWNTWQTITVPNVLLVAGTQTLRIYALTDGWNLNWIEVNLPAQTPLALVAGHIYKVTAKHSGKALDVATSSQTDGGNVQQWTYGSGLNQQWMAEDAGSGAWRLTPQHSPQKPARLWRFHRRRSECRSMEL